jgi:asparagine synthase (glutamine-hydrolysing)
MCGVAGYISNNKPNSASLKLKKLVNDLKHRGPDGNGIFKSKDSKVGLIHTRLAILDLTNLAKQPMFNKDSSVILSFNGEIYNFIELKQELETDGIKFRSSSDTEVILELYLKYRQTPNFETVFLNRLNGIFSFAIWDEHFGRMMIARDAMGVKPIYYCLRADMLAFASELKALINFVPNYNIKKNKNSANIVEKIIDPRLDLEALSRYMTFLWCPGTSTPLEDIKKLGPGEFLSFGLNGCVVHKSWIQKRLITKFEKKLNQGFITKQSILETEKLLKNAVQRQMISDVPVGAFLSGGLDSSAIVTFARQINPNIECFTIKAQGYEEEGFDDYPYAVKVAKHLGIKLNPVIVKPDDIINNIHNMVEILDEPLADPAALNIYFISEAAKKLGIKVLLSGAGGDDIFSGYRRHFAIKYNSYFRQIPIPLRRVIHNILNKINSNQATIRRLKKLFNNYSMETNQFLINCFKWINKNDLESLYSPELIDALKNTSVESPMHAFLNNTDNNNLSDLQKSLAMERIFFLADHNLTYTDKMSMAKGVEVRVPFLDNDLVNFASQLPDNVLIKNRNAKWLLKKSMQPHLPKDIIYRPKTGFGMPLRKWIKFELRDFVNDTLNDQVVARRGLFNPKAVKNLIAANQKGDVDMSYTIFSLVCIELWCQRFL